TAKVSAPRRWVDVTTCSTPPAAPRSLVARPVITLRSRRESPPTRSSRHPPPGPGWPAGRVPGGGRSTAHGATASRFDGASGERHGGAGRRGLTRGPGGVRGAGRRVRRRRGRARRGRALRLARADARLPPPAGGPCRRRRGDLPGRPVPPGGGRRPDRKGGAGTGAGRCG